MRPKRPLRPVPAALAALALCLAAAAVPATAAPADAVPADAGPRRLIVTAEGRAEAVPDLALVTVGVETQAPTAAAALAENSARIAAVIARLRVAGIDPRDLQTSTLSLGPRHEFRPDRPPVLVGFAASNQLTVRVRALDTLGEILDAAVAEGANMLSGLSFLLADPQATRDAALAAAVAEARRRAALIADAAGVRLGPVLSVTEQGRLDGPLPVSRMAIAEAAPTVPVEAGEIGFAATVTLVYALAD